ncbi:UNVERIFIED_CONTAM: U-box domain-containing protein 62 [Sesamum calycinum]|uniref:U-box domain-containing protein 62 n=1 Tax=Sesamum calycinum TaxID=2727403 RepID=A0AAW2PTE3_9LAMI
MHQHQNHGNPPPSSAAIGSIRSPPSHSHSHSHSHRLPSPSPLSLDAPSRIRLSDILPYDGTPMAPYIRAVDALSNSLMRHNAAVIELGPEDAALLRCALESARLYFRTRKGGRGVYTYRAGRPLEDVDASPPCMADIFRCMGRAARAALSAIARHLRLRSDVFNHLLDDNPLPANGRLRRSLLPPSPRYPCSKEKVCDPNGRWYQADSSLAPGDLLLLTGKALSHATAGLRPAASYRATPDNLLNPATGGRTSLAFRLMPQGNAVLDCTPIAAAGHVIPPSYVPISVSQFMDDLSAEEDVLCNHTDNAYVPADNLNREPSLRSVLSDPLSGAFLEDAMLVSCGHSFGGLMLRKVIEMSKCTLCNSEIEAGSLIPNHALRAAALAVKQEDDRRLFHNVALRKRRKEASEQRENGDLTPENGSLKVYNFLSQLMRRKQTLQGNRRTPDKFVGKEAVITSQCLNGWYLLKIIESGENVRLQYRSLRKIPTSHDLEDRYEVAIKNLDRSNWEIHAQGCGGREANLVARRAITWFQQGDMKDWMNARNRR